jgi:hypothetical protein
LPEEAETEQHQRGVVGEDLVGFLCRQVVEFGESLAGHEAAEGVDVVANHEEQLQAALGRFADAGVGGFFNESVPDVGFGASTIRFLADIGAFINVEYKLSELI